MREYRPIPDAHRHDRRRITSYAFDAASGPYDPDATVDERRERMWSYGDRYGLFEGDDLLACCTHYEFTTRVRGTWVTMAGLGGVASPPEHRRKGYVGELLEASLSDYRERGWPLAALRPFDESFYARYGWATGCRYQVATVEPAALAPARTASTAADDGEFRRVRPGEYEQLVPVYEAWLDGVNLATRRSSGWWRDRVFQSPANELYGSVWLRAGEPRGYLLYDVTDDRRLRTREVAFVDGEAYLHLLRFCHDHDSQVEAVELYGTGHDRLLDVVADRDAVELEVAAGQMVRVVDVVAALESVPYPGVETADLVLSVDDDHAVWNDDAFRVRVLDGEATVERTDADPDARLDVGILSQLLVGYRPVERARTTGNLDVLTDGSSTVLERMFPVSESFLPERF